MNKELKTIQAGQGLGSIKFGITRDELNKIIGEPDEVDSFSHSEDEDDVTEAWHYDMLELSASFDQLEDWRLVTLSVSSPKYLFEGRSLIGTERKELIKVLQELGLNDLEFEDWSSAESPDHKLIASEEAGMNFWLDGGTLTEIQWTPLYSEEQDCLLFPETED
jgi:hypothetical protein